MLGLQGQPRVLQHPLHSHDVGLPLGSHAHHPVHGLGDAQAVGHRQTGHPHPDGVVRRHSQHRRRPDHHRRQSLQPHRQPPVPRHHQVVRLGVLPEPLDVHVVHPALLPVGADGHGAVEALPEPGEDRGPQVRLHALELPGGGDVVVLDALVGVDDGQHHHQKRWRGGGNHHIHGQHAHQHREVAEERVLELLINRVHVLGEPVHHPPQRGGVVEGHGHLQHVPEQGVVAGPGGPEAGLQEGEGGGDDREEVEHREHGIDADSKSRGDTVSMVRPEGHPAIGASTHALHKPSEHHGAQEGRCTGPAQVVAVDTPTDASGHFLLLLHQGCDLHRRRLRLLPLVLRGLLPLLGLAPQARQRRAHRVVPLELPRRPRLHRVPVQQNHLLRLVHHRVAVRGEDHRAAPAEGPDQGGQQLLGHVGVHGGQGVVQDEDVGLGVHRSGQGDAGLLPAG
mmetsp:Transcript_93415/g.250197  ORF Transcript_93415/g.250197 Transcript_93415/m.250197 type:complete len:451 (-) Transcript_93415:346-1698(-)